MIQMIFINLPVTDLNRAIAFYEAIGATRNMFCEEGTAIGMTFSDAIHVMLLTHEKFSEFTTRPIAGRDTVETLLCLSCDSRAAVDAMVTRAAGAGGAPDPTPTQEFGFMYGRSFEDPDGHIWEVMWMDPAGFKAAASGEPAVA
ncbi:VOC family protein [Acuticoccus sp. I52.16.1]|uniref:VOC family protein n=1 Tax=Acuticoccus sp. I52.16.1 TaxID=2928472 RepID=UPI001FD02969|nr:VOC family protein [Acuticoccus sp. I52.16.1]UOM34526.1 VOC family protein [Acuticoccus sp. I52.16.1]